MFEYIAPEYELEAFNCPYCNAFAHQKWYEEVKAFSIYPNRNINNIKGMELLDSTQVSICEKCKNFSLWINGKMIYPFNSTAPLPLDEMPEKVKKYYIEARDIFNRSYCGALVVLRVALQELMKELGYEGKYLHKNINNLLKEENIKDDVKEAVTIIKDYGNDGAHDEIEVIGNEETALYLFNLLNYIVDQQIIRPNKLAELKQLRNKDEKSN